MTQIRGRRTGAFNPHAGTYNALFGKSDDVALYLAVIRQHIEDATSVIPVGMAGFKGASADLARQEARDWLLKPNAGFEEVCTLANVEPRDVRNAAAAKIEAFDRRHPEVMREATRREEERHAKHDAEQAIGFTAQSCGGSVAQTLTFNGEIMTVKQWSERTGIGRHTIGYRLRQGWSVEQALTGATARTLTHAGKTQTVTEWANETGIKDKTIYKRLHNGWSIERALTP